MQTVLDTIKTLRGNKSVFHHFYKSLRCPTILFWTHKVKEQIKNIHMQRQSGEWLENKAGNGICTRRQPKDCITEKSKDIIEGQEIMIQRRKIECFCPLVLKNTRNNTYIFLISIIYKTSYSNLMYPKCLSSYSLWLAAIMRNLRGILNALMPHVGAVLFLLQYIMLYRITTGSWSSHGIHIGNMT